jgi:hypothetical protein
MVCIHKGALREEKTRTTRRPQKERYVPVYEGIVRRNSKEEGRQLGDSTHPPIQQSSTIYRRRSRKNKAK